MNNYEVNFDGLIGPTHNYSGLPFGNLASSRNAQQVSNPRLAALQGLEKMRALVALGYKQGFLLPQQRPDIPYLRRLGFSGSDRDVINKASRTASDLLLMVYSASSMWAANSATVTASTDSVDGKIHFTPANMLSNTHRCIEHQATKQCLQTIFNDREYFTVHFALPSQNRFADEGAANHTRLCTDYSQPGISLFVYGRDGADHDHLGAKYPARQTLAACQAIARQHQLTPGKVAYLQQSVAAINAGAFHNDVVAVGNGPVLLFHEQAFDQQSQAAVFSGLSEHFSLQYLCVPASRVNLDEAVNSYLFNSQLLAAPDGSMEAMRLIAPTESRDNQTIRDYLEELIEDPSNVIHAVEFVDVRQSMGNGGGPACLRLRVVMNDKELQAVNPRFLLNNESIDILQQWVKKHYRETLSPKDLGDYQLLEESYAALDELTQLLKIGSYYPFQK